MCFRVTRLVDVPSIVLVCCVCVTFLACVVLHCVCDRAHVLCCLDGVLVSDMYDSKLSGAMDPSGKYAISTVLSTESALSDRRRQRVIECDSVRLDKRECA